LLKKYIAFPPSSCDIAKTRRNRAILPVPSCRPIDRVLPPKGPRKTSRWAGLSVQHMSQTVCCATAVPPHQLRYWYAARRVCDLARSFSRAGASDCAWHRCGRASSPRCQAHEKSLAARCISLITHQVVRSCVCEAPDPVTVHPKATPLFVLLCCCNAPLHHNQDNGLTTLHIAHHSSLPSHRSQDTHHTTTD
jgi:hypothetical protein